MKDNRGFSLVELIAVVAIMAVLIGFGATRIDVVFGYSAKEARSKINSSLESLQVSCISKSKGNAQAMLSGTSLNADVDIYMEIYRDENKSGVYYLKYHDLDNAKEVNETKVKLGPRRIGISYQLKDAPSPVEVGKEGNGLFLAYNRETGGFLPLRIVGGKPVYVKYIYCGSGDKTYTLELMPKTGKVIMR